MFDVKKEFNLGLINSIAFYKDNDYTPKETSKQREFKRVGFTTEIIQYLYYLINKNAGNMAYLSAIHWALIYANLNPLNYINQNGNDIKLNTSYLYDQYSMTPHGKKTVQIKNNIKMIKSDNKQYSKAIIEINNILLNPIALTMFSEKKLNLIQAVLLEAEGLKTELTKNKKINKKLYKTNKIIRNKTQETNLIRNYTIIENKLKQYKKLSTEILQKIIVFYFHIHTLNLAITWGW